MELKAFKPSQHTLTMKLPYFSILGHPRVSFKTSVKAVDKLDNITYYDLLTVKDNNEDEMMNYQQEHMG